MSIQRTRLLQAYERYFLECRDIFTAKNKDYNKDEDPLSGFRDFGALGILVRLTDKFGRIKNLHNRGGVGAVVTESIKDTLQDICNYCFLMYVIMEDESVGLINKASGCITEEVEATIPTPDKDCAVLKCSHSPKSAIVGDSWYNPETKESFKAEWVSSRDIKVLQRFKELDDTEKRRFFNGGLIGASANVSYEEFKTIPASDY